MISPAEKCADLIRHAESIAALTGAGISTNAGIPDFRGPKGLYVTKQYDADTVFDIDYFHQDQKPFFDFARDFIKLEESIQPTFSHHFLAKLEQQGKLRGVITQNIDYLHQRAGSQKVLEVHGSFWTSSCLECRQGFGIEHMRNKILDEEVPRCLCGGVIKPDIVFFGENVKDFENAALLAREADLFFVIGTSCVVYPAASLPSYSQGKIILINRGEVHFSSQNVVLNINEDADVFLAEVAALLEN